MRSICGLGLALVALQCAVGTAVADPFYSLPSSVPVTSGLILSFNASNGVTTEAGNRVTSWSNQGSLGAGGNLLQTSGSSARPTLTSNVINGFPAVQFDKAIGQQLSSAAFAAQSQPNTYFLVARNDSSAISPTSFMTFFSSGTGNATTNNFWVTPTSSIANRIDMYAGTAERQTTASFTPDAFHVFMLQFNHPNNGLPVLDGNPLTIAAGTPGSDAITGFRLGANATGGEFLGGAIAEVLVYNRLLTADEQNIVGSYLSLKYGLTTAYTFDFPDLLTPEPSSFVLAGVSLVGLFGLAWRRKRA